MMYINNLLDSFSTPKRKKINTAHYMAAGMCIATIAGVCVATGVFLHSKSGKELRSKMKNRAIDTVDDLKNIVIKYTDSIKVSAAHAADHVCSAVEAAEDKAAAVKREFCCGSDKIAQDVQDTAENITQAYTEATDD
jgi:gas vesicle protein